jgi:hypothetical protein
MAKLAKRIFGRLFCRGRRSAALGAAAQPPAAERLAIQSATTSQGTVAYSSDDEEEGDSPLVDESDVLISRWLDLIDRESSRLFGFSRGPLAAFVRHEIFRAYDLFQTIGGDGDTFRSIADAYIDHQEQINLWRRQIGSGAWSGEENFIVAYHEFRYCGRLIEEFWSNVERFIASLNRPQHPPAYEASAIVGPTDELVDHYLSLPNYSTATCTRCASRSTMLIK